MDKEERKKPQEQETQDSELYPRTCIIVDGEVFPFSMTCKEYDEYLKYLEEKKSSKK